MSNNSFFSIPREKLLTLYPAIIKNSDEQYQTAIEIYENGKPGIAIPHLLISSEELIKALIVVLDAKGFKFRTIKGMDIFFRNHEIRFFISALIFVVSLFGDDLFRFLEKMKTDHTKAMSMMLNIKNREESSMNKIKWYFLRKYVIIQAEIKWFSNAELFRQNGFYVDMSGNLVSPLTITPQQFQETKMRIDKVNKIIKYMIETFESDEDVIKEEIERFKISCDTENYYTLIANELENMRKGRKSFFQVFISNVFDNFSDRNDRKQFKSFSELMAKSKSNNPDNTEHPLN
jgi:AbiV family abortive infection protein